MTENEKATVTGVFANYVTLEEGAGGETIRRVNTARTGDPITASPAEIDRLRRAGVLDSSDPAGAGERALNPTDTVPPGETTPVEAAPPSLGRAPAGRVLLREDTTGGGGVIPLDTDMSDPASVAAWISAERPNASQVVDAAGSDPGRAAVLLEAETLSHDGDPRKTVAEPLQKIIDGSGS